MGGSCKKVYIHFLSVRLWFYYRSASTHVIPSKVARAAIMSVIKKKDFDAENVQEVNMSD